MSTGLKLRKKSSSAAVEDTASETSGSGAPSPTASSSDLTGLTKADESRSFESLKERSAIPFSIYMIYGTIAALHYSVGFYSRETFESWGSSMSTSFSTFAGMLGYTGTLTMTLWEGDRQEWQIYAKAAVLFVIIASLLYVFVGAPLLAGFWTGRRTSRHRIHRYAGLLYLVQYTCVWIEYFTNYKDGATYSYLPHCIALNGKNVSLLAEDVKILNSTHSNACDRCYSGNLSLLLV